MRHKNTYCAVAVYVRGVIGYFVLMPISQSYVGLLKWQGLVWVLKIIPYVEIFHLGFVPTSFSFKRSIRLN